MRVRADAQLRLSLRFTISFCFQLAIAFDGASEENERSPAAEALVNQDENGQNEGKKGKKGKKRTDEISALILSR